MSVARRLSEVKKEKVLFEPNQAEVKKEINQEKQVTLVKTQ
jgi:hypothetical protein